MEAAASSRLPQHVYAAMRQSDTATIATWLDGGGDVKALYGDCLLYTSPSPRD